MFDFICEQFVLFFELLERVDVDFLANHFLGVGFDVLDEICEILADVEQHFLIWLLSLFGCAEQIELQFFEI